MFEHAKFRDLFVTETGEIVVYLRCYISNEYKHFVSNGKWEFSVDENGICDKNLYKLGENIVGPYIEESQEKFIYG